MAIVDFTQEKFDELGGFSPRIEHFVEATKNISRWSNPTAIIYADYWLKRLLDKHYADNNKLKESYDKIEKPPVENSTLQTVLECFINYNIITAVKARTKQLMNKTKTCAKKLLSQTLTQHTTFQSYVMGKSCWPWSVSLRYDSDLTYTQIDDEKLYQQTTTKSYNLNKDTLYKISTYLKEKKPDEENSVYINDLEDAWTDDDAAIIKKTEKEPIKLGFFERLKGWVTKKFGRTKSRKDNWIMKGR